MPNWCSNQLTITGSPEDVAAFRAHFSDRPFSFGIFDPMPDELSNIIMGGCNINGVRVERWRDIPCASDVPGARKTSDGFLVSVPVSPEEFESLKAKYGASDWYAWRYSHIGCKWDVDGTVVEESPGHLVLSFDSAWSPPCVGVDALSKRFSSLRFVLAYAEQGAGFYGETSYPDGGIVDDKFRWLDKPDDEDADHWYDRPFQERLVPEARAFFEARPHLHDGG